MKKAVLLFLLFCISTTLQAQRIKSLQEILMEQLVPSIFPAIERGDLQYLEHIPFTVNSKAQEMLKKSLIAESLELFSYIFDRSFIKNQAEYITTEEVTCTQTSSDGRFIGFGHDNGSLTLFDTNSQQFTHIDLYAKDPLNLLEWHHDCQNILITTESGMCGIYNIFDGTLYDLTEKNERVMYAFWVNNSQSIYFLIAQDDSTSFKSVKIQDLINNQNGKDTLLTNVMSMDSNFYICKTSDYVIFIEKNNFYIFSTISGILAEITIDLPIGTLPVGILPEIDFISTNDFSKSLLVNFSNIKYSYLLSIPNFLLKRLDKLYFPIAWQDSSTMLTNVANDTIQYCNYITGRIDHEMHFPSKFKLVATQQHILAALTKEARSYMLQIIHPLVRNRIYLHNGFNQNMRVYITPNMGAIWVIQGIIEDQTKISIFDSSLALGVALTVKQIILVELMIRHKKLVSYLKQSDFWKDAYESLPEEITNLLDTLSKTLNPSCVIS